MKKELFFFLLFCAVTLVLDAQNIGIGNANPQFRLDVSGRMRIRGGIDNNHSAGLWLSGTGADSAKERIFVGMLTDSIAGFYSSKSEVSWSLLFDGRNGNIGIKNTNPFFPLSFQNLAGDKISLYQDINNGNYYGMGIGNSVLQMITPGNTTDIVFGYGKSAAFTENMRIKGNGNVGIGVSDPVYPLDISNRMRIRGKPGFTAGIWLNNEANTAIPAFIGMQSENQVGFFGFNGTGWSFLMNTQTGAISFGGNSGQPGQVLTSNGTAGAPTWQGGIGNGKAFVVRPSANSADLGTSGRVDVPNMVANFTLTVPSQVVFNFKLSIANRGCFACGERRTFIVLIQNIVGGTTDIATTTVYTPNQEIADGVSGPIVLDLPAGTYSYKLAIASSIYGAASVWARQQEGIMTWQIYPN